jgi:hypothetical protein
MARTLTTKDGYQLMNLLVRQATGQAAQSVVDASTFVSAGETVLATGKENTMNALSLVLGRTFAAVRPYNAKLALMNAINTGVYSHRLRKISYYAQDALPSGYFNTDINTNFAEGFTAGENPDAQGVAQSTKSQYEQHPAMPLEVNFAGSTTWQDCITMYEDKLEQAFNSVESFNAFIEGILVEHGNDIESQKEAWNRMTLLSAIATRIYLAGQGVAASSVINLTSEFNTYFGTTYTSAQLRSTYLKEFLEFMVSVIKETSDRMTERGTAYHDPMTKTVSGVSYSVLRHSPKDRQRLYLYNPLFRKSEAIVMPEIFRPEYLNMEKQFERIEYWQSNDSDTNRSAINFNSAYLDSSDGTQKATGAVTASYVVGVLADEDAFMTDFQLEKALTSPLEARKGYRNNWLTFAKNAIIDQTENMVVFIMAD